MYKLSIAILSVFMFSSVGLTALTNSVSAETLIYETDFSERPTEDIDIKTGKGKK